ncbi:hypothetical protein BYT27DRAFT_7281210, partial [Phlegmacium glaucopus]
MHTKQSEHWFMGGRPFHCRLVQAVYMISYLCLLHIDEVLKIRREHIKLEEEGKVTLTLPLCKTHQFGDIKPFVLYPLSPEETYLCP